MIEQNQKLVLHRWNDTVRIPPFRVTVRHINRPYTAVFGEVTVKIRMAVSIDVGLPIR